MTQPGRKGRWYVLTVSGFMFLCMFAGRVPSAYAQGGPPPGKGPGPPEFSLDSVSSSVSVDNQIFSAATGTIDVTVGHTGGPGGYVLTVSRGSSPAFDPREMVFQGWFGVLLPRLAYNIFTPADEIALDLSVSLANDNVIRGNFGNSGSSYNTANHLFEIRIPEDQFVRRGTYQDQVDVTLYQGRSLDPETLEFVARETVTIVSETPTVAEIALSGQSDHTMDFGQLSPGITRSVELQYRTNVGFRITAVSENQGVLVNPSDATGETIPYQLFLDEESVDLSSPRIVELSLLFGTTIDFESIPVDVTIGSFDQVTPGLFQDVVTFTISTF